MNKRLKEICKILFATDYGVPIALSMDVDNPIRDKYLQVHQSVCIYYNGSDTKHKLIDVRLTDYLYAYFELEKIHNGKTRRWLIYDTTYAGGCGDRDTASMDLQALRTMYLRQSKINNIVDE
jgi:hypothetical protein